MDRLVSLVRSDRKYSMQQQGDAKAVVVAFVKMQMLVSLLVEMCCEWLLIVCS